MARQEIRVLIDAEALCNHTLRLTGNLNNFPKSQISMLKNGIPFLGFHFYIKNGLCIVKLINNKARAYRRKYNRLHRKVKAGELPRAVLDTSLRSYMAHASYCTDQRFRLYYNKKEKELDV